MLMRSCFAILALILNIFLSACAPKKEEALKEETPDLPKTVAVKPGEMVLIPGGEFIFEKDSSAYPQQKVDLPAFWIDKYEVTNSEYLDFCIKTRYVGEAVKEGKDWRTFFTPDKGLFPVVFITWNDAQAYCESVGKRLPNEKEWEKAARGIHGNRYPWGNDWEVGRSNTYEAGLASPAAVGRFDDVSPYGVHDMLGNVQEWTASWYLPYEGNRNKEPNFGKRFRVVRGLSSRYFGDRGSLWVRSAYLPNSVYDFGFRCAKNATEKETSTEAQGR